MPKPTRTRITDPERIRALAHPLRLELLDYLARVDEATATQCAEKTGDSVASCSFHLRMLSKYGYIEPAPRRGREKPWKIIREVRDMAPDHDIPGSLAASVELAQHMVIYESERIRRFLSHAPQEDPAWIDSTAITRSDMWVTKEEMKEISEVVARELAVKYLGRNENPSERPEGARMARFFFVFNPEPRE